MDLLYVQSDAYAHTQLSNAVEFYDSLQKFAYVAFRFALSLLYFWLLFHSFSPSNHFFIFTICLRLSYVSLPRALLCFTSFSVPLDFLFLSHCSYTSVCPSVPSLLFKCFIFTISYFFFFFFSHLCARSVSPLHRLLQMSVL